MEISKIILTVIESILRLISCILNVFVHHFKKRSSLVLNNIEIERYVDPRGVPFVPVAKDPILLKAAKTLEGRIFTSSAIVSLTPTFLGLRSLLATYVSELHRVIRDNLTRYVHQYDRRELFTFQDGG